MPCLTAIRVFFPLLCPVDHKIFLCAPTECVWQWSMSSSVSLRFDRYKKLEDK